MLVFLYTRTKNLFDGFNRFVTSIKRFSASSETKAVKPNNGGSQVLHGDDEFICFSCGVSYRFHVEMGVELFSWFESIGFHPYI